MSDKRDEDDPATWFAEQFAAPGDEKSADDIVVAPRGDGQMTDAEDAGTPPPRRATPAVDGDMSLRRPGVPGAGGFTWGLTPHAPDADDADGDSAGRDSADSVSAAGAAEEGNRAPFTPVTSYPVPVPASSASAPRSGRPFFPEPARSDVVTPPSSPDVSETPESAESAEAGGAAASTEPADSAASADSAVSAESPGSAEYVEPAESVGSTNPAESSESFETAESPESPESSAAPSPSDVAELTAAIPTIQEVLDSPSPRRAAREAAAKEAALREAVAQGDETDAAVDVQSSEQPPSAPTGSPMSESSTATPDAAATPDATATPVDEGVGEPDETGRSSFEGVPAGPSDAEPNPPAGIPIGTTQLPQAAEHPASQTTSMPAATPMQAATPIPAATPFDPAGPLFVDAGAGPRDAASNGRADSPPPEAKPAKPPRVTRLGRRAKDVDESAPGTGSVAGPSPTGSTTAGASATGPSTAQPSIANAPNHTPSKEARVASPGDRSDDAADPRSAKSDAEPKAPRNQRVTLIVLVVLAVVLVGVVVYNFLR